MSYAATSVNTNAIGILPGPNVTVGTVTLDFPDTGSHQVLVIGHFSVDTEGAGGGIITAAIFANRQLITNTQINNLEGNTGALVSISSVVTVGPGPNSFDLQAGLSNMTSAAVHHRSVTAVGIG